MDDLIEQELHGKSLTLKEQAQSMTIKDVAGYAAAGELGKGIKELRAKIVEYFAPIKKAAHEAHKAVTAKEGGELKPIDEALAILRDTMNVYSREQERIRQEEERKAQQKAEAEAEKERQRLLAQAVKAEEKGKDEKAGELLERAENVYTAPVTVAPTIAKTVATSAGNITQAKEVHITVVNLAAFLTEVIAKNPAALSNIVDIKQGPLKSWVKANGFNNYSGLRIEKTTGVRF